MDKEGGSLIVLLLITTPYIRPDGLGAPYARYLPRLSCGLRITIGTREENDLLIERLKKFGDL